MKIVQIVGSFTNAHREISYGIHKYLEENEHESYILYISGDAVPESDVIQCETKFENVVKRAIGKYICKSPRLSFPSTKRIVDYIKKIKPDIVHLHVLHHGYTDYVYLFKSLAKLKIPVVFTMHDLWAATGGCYYYTAAGCEGFKTGCQNCPLDSKFLDCRKEKTSVSFEKKKSMYKSVDKISFVAVSPWVQSELSKGMLKDYPLYTVFNSAFIPYIPFDIQSKKEDKFTVLGVAAAWVSRKGIDRFISLAKMLGDDYKISLVGNVNKEIKKNAPKNMEFFGTVKDKEKLYSLYSASHLHVSLSFEETFGLTFIESAFAGTKALGFNSTAIPGVLEKTYGYIIDSQKVEAVAEKIRELNGKREDCSLTKEQSESVKNFFSTRRMAKEYFEIYKKTANG